MCVGAKIIQAFAIDVIPIVVFVIEMPLFLFFRRLLRDSKFA